MMKLTRIELGGVMVTALLISSAACKRESKDEGTADQTAKVGTDRPVTPSPDPRGKPAASDAQEHVVLYQRCWADFNARRWDAFRTCYATGIESEEIGSDEPTLRGVAAVVEDAQRFAAAFPDVAGEQQLILVNGDTVQSITLVRGTHEGVLRTPMGELPPTNQKIGLLMAHGVDLDDTGKAIKEWSVMDQGSLLGQLGKLPAGIPFRPVIEQGWPDQPVVIARNDGTEQRNLAAYKSLVAAFNAHDLEAFTSQLADTGVWEDLTMPTAVGKEELVAMMPQVWKAFGDLKIEPTRTWAAGDYVMSRGTMTGTNDGPLPSMGLAKATGKKVSSGYLEIARFDQAGKVAAGWLFANSLQMAQQLGMLDQAKPDDKSKRAP